MKKELYEKGGKTAGVSDNRKSSTQKNMKTRVFHEISCFLITARLTFRLSNH